MSPRNSASREEVVAANVEEHAGIAIEYERRTREVATDPELWNTWYFDHLRKAIDEIREANPGATARALDALGGTGKTTLFLQRHGLDVTLVDVSPEMTDIYRRIAGELGYDVDVVLADIQAFLDDPDTPTYDLITASSALHHIADYVAVVRQFYDKLEPGGFLHTAWDPLPRSRRVRVMERVEYYSKRVGSPAATLRGARRRIRRRRTGSGVDHEFHKVVDDVALIAAAESMGFRVREHRRNAGGSLKWTKPLWERFGAYTTFALLLQKPSD